jgi:hypothetical protein
VADPVTTGLVIAGTLGVAKRAEDFIAAVSGHAGESLGTILGTIANRRITNAEAVSGKAHLILLDIGEKPREIPLNILQPVLEGASLQDDPDLQNTWANLLANAADAKNRIHIEPSFARILRELSSREVQFLDSLYRELGSLYTLQFDEESLRRQYASAGLGQSADDGAFGVMMDILEGNRILRRDARPTAETGMRRSGRLNVPPLPVQTVEHYSFTRLGIAFVRACRKPEPPSQ